MVFGWGKKKPLESPVERKLGNQNIALTDIPRIVSDLSKLRESETLSEIKNLRNNTAPLIDDLMKIGIVLEKDDLEIDGIDKHLAIIVVRGKQQVIDILKKDVKNLMQVSTLGDAKKLDYFLNQVLKKVGDVLGRQTRVIHIFAKKYAIKLKNDLKIITDENEEINTLINNFSELENNVEQIFENLDQYNQSQKLIITLRERQKQSEKTLQNIFNIIDIIDQPLYRGQLVTAC